MEFVALHGFGGSGADFDVLRPWLSAEFEWRTPDLGLDWDAARAQARTEGVLLGYSMGARIALDAALRHPPRALVLVGATAGLDGPEREERKRADKALAVRIERLGAEAFDEEWSQAPLIATQDRMPEPWRSALRARRRTQSVDRLMRQPGVFGQGASPSQWTRLASLAVPTLVVSGAEDTKYTTLGVRIASALPFGHHRAIEEAGHAPHLEAPERFAAAFTQWWADAGVGGTPPSPELETT